MGIKIKFINKNTIKLDKIINELDKFVFKFVKILERHTDYVIVSGYVAILLGRSRTTEDIDIFIKEMSFKKFNKFYEELKENGYWCLNAEDSKEIYDYLLNNCSIRFAIKNQTVPNFEIKFAKKLLDLESFKDVINVVTEAGELKISSLERQIAFERYCLKSDRYCIEDAKYIKNLLNKNNYKMKYMKPGKDNKEDRLNFVRYWAEYVRTHPDKVWSKQQNILINSAIQNARSIKLTREEYLKIKGELQNKNMS